MAGDWSTVHAERAALADHLSRLPPERWATPSLCTGWAIREVLAHLTAAASLTTVRWFAGVVRCRFDFNRQVDMRLREQLGATPQDTLAGFRRFLSSRRAAAGPSGRCRASSSCTPRTSAGRGASRTSTRSASSPRRRGSTAGTTSPSRPSG